MSGTKVFFHLKDGKKSVNKSRSVKRLPKIGEQVSLSAGGPVYEVDQLLHNFFKDGCDYEVEVYAHKVS
ncbi:hypothetical protein [Eubacterium limosum]|uniref:Uncharacterized protein n=1 Tax=Eubacterium limosum TaxID=1736 RepID=A0AAC9QSM9_EUBLI|nr:hypothetical protein [Eubacterium limosum]ARD64983.1 hypothetical protein B2M23_05240 [Eubacterium limosum]PWW52993.1 hypothetical protein C7955_106265 [Eubacterium limosum]UQZ20995.1 hypothetical protein M5595_12185 [Eubacterium limosum]